MTIGFCLCAVSVIILTYIYSYQSCTMPLIRMTRDFIRFAHVPLTPHEKNREYLTRLTYERGTSCNVYNRTGCKMIDKSLVVSFFSERSKSKWVSEHILSYFSPEKFDYMIFVYDDSIWTTHPLHSRSIFIQVASQQPYWYLKRFLKSNIVQSYRYIWVLNDDAELLFNPNHYECILNKLNIQLSTPIRLKGAVSHEITRLNSSYKDRIGRWTDFVEIGPAFIVTPEAWRCIDFYSDEALGTGWGLDMVWCRMLGERCFPKLGATKVCAIIDAFGFNHQSDQINSGPVGEPEKYFYERKYFIWISKFQVYGELAQNNSILRACQ